MKVCEVDEDCIPNSLCMTAGCMNKAYADYLDRDPDEPLVCHQMYILNRATSEGCVCQEGLCVNSNTGEE